jgi:hypothetical protein
MYSHGSFISSASFNVGRSEDDRWLEIEGEVDGTCNWEAPTQEYPGSVEYDVDYRTLAIWGDVGWRDVEADEWHSMTIKLYNKDAEAFLSGWSICVEDEVDNWDEGDYDESRI